MFQIKAACGRCLGILYSPATAEALAKGIQLGQQRRRVRLRSPDRPPGGRLERLQIVPASFVGKASQTFPWELQQVWASLQRVVQKSLAILPRNGCVCAHNRRVKHCWLCPAPGPSGWLKSSPTSLPQIYQTFSRALLLQV